MYSQPSFSPEYSVDVPKKFSKFCHYNVDLGLENNVLNMLGGNVKNFGSLGYFSGYDVA